MKHVYGMCGKVSECLSLFLLYLSPCVCVCVCGCYCHLPPHFIHTPSFTSHFTHRTSYIPHAPHPTCPTSPKQTHSYQSLGREGYHSLYRWYTAFEQEHFPDPQGLRRQLSVWTLGLYPRCIQWLMAVFDVPECIAVTRDALCKAGGAAGLSRVQVRLV